MTFWFVFCVYILQIKRAYAILHNRKSKICGDNMVYDVMVSYQHRSRNLWGEGKMADIKYDIVEEIGVLSENAKGWRKEINRISWNGATPKYDIRDWAPEHEKMSKGITLSQEEVEELYAVLGKALGK